MLLGGLFVRVGTLTNAAKVLALTSVSRRLHLALQLVLIFMYTQVGSLVFPLILACIHRDIIWNSKTPICCFPFSKTP